MIESIPADGQTLVGMRVTAMGVNGRPQGVFSRSDFMAQKPSQQDPTPEEIWGTETKIGLAETIRMEREQPENKGCYRPPMIKECSTKMLPSGRGVLRGQG